MNSSLREKQEREEIGREREGEKRTFLNEKKNEWVDNEVVSISSSSSLFLCSSCFSLFSTIFCSLSPWSLHIPKQIIIMEMCCREREKRKREKEEKREGKQEMEWMGKEWQIKCLSFDPRMEIKFQSRVFYPDNFHFRSFTSPFLSLSLSPSLTFSLTHSIGTSFMKSWRKWQRKRDSKGEG